MPSSRWRCPSRPCRKSRSWAGWPGSRRRLYGKEPPPFSRSYITSRLAYRIQELAHGGLKPETRARLEALGEQLDGGNIVLRRIRADSRPLPGTRLIREHDGVQHDRRHQHDGPRATRDSA